MSIVPLPARRHPAPHHLRGWGSVRIVGSGRLEFRLQGSGSLAVGRLRQTAFTFEGRGARRFPDADTLVVCAAHGRLVLQGTDLDVAVDRGHVDLRAEGEFQVRLDGRGEWLTPAGERRGWGLDPRVVAVRTSASIPPAGQGRAV